MFVSTTETIMPSDQDAQMARTSSTILASLLDKGGADKAHLSLKGGDEQKSEISLPASAVRLLLQALQEMAKGNAVTLLHVDTELTTQQAAELLRVSRPSVIKLLDEGKMPYRKVGAHRRIRYEDILFYKETERARRVAVMHELVAETERIGLY